MRYINIMTLLPGPAKNQLHNNRKQKGYVIPIVLVAFALIIGMLIFPVKFPLTSGDGCRVGEVVDPEKEPTVLLPPIVNVGTSPAKTPPDTPGGWDDTKPNVEYVVIRKNVPIFMNSTKANYVLGYPDIVGHDVPGPPTVVKWPIIADTEYLGRNADVRHTIKYAAANQAGFDVYYPVAGGELELAGMTTNRNGDSSAYLNLKTEGFLIFVHLDKNGKAVKLNYGEHIYYLVDFYQDKQLYETPKEAKGYEIDDLFHCLDPEAHTPDVAYVPSQDVSQGKDQLQMEWFLLQGGAGMYAHCKPAVYLYPEKKQLVNVKVFPKGELTYTDPVYDPTKGWTVEAFPDGKLQIPNFQFPISNSQYDLGSQQKPRPASYAYLYYESKLYDSEIKKPTKGWVVKSEDLERLFNRVLPKLGLNKKEQADFMDYWLTKLPSSPYYFVGLVNKDQRDYLEPLSVTPKPETSIRFSLYFEPLDGPRVTEEPVIKTPSRNGFTLVDWGGMIKLHKDSPFTCSQ